MDCIISFLYIYVCVCDCLHTFFVFYSIIICDMYIVFDWPCQWFDLIKVSSWRRMFVRKHETGLLLGRKRPHECSHSNVQPFFYRLLRTYRISNCKLTNLTSHLQGENEREPTYNKNWHSIGMCMSTVTWLSCKVHFPVFIRELSNIHLSTIWDLFSITEILFKPSSHIETQ